jgi:hypothetical protein
MCGGQSRRRSFQAPIVNSAAFAAIAAFPAIRRGPQSHCKSGLAGEFGCMKPSSGDGVKR